MATAPKPTDGDDIRRRMAQIRHELHEDMQGVVAGAEAASDPWRYVTRYPWLAVLVALLVGYFVVPRRRRSVSEVAEQVAERTREEVQAVARTNGPVGRGTRTLLGASTAEKQKSGITGMLFGLVAPLAMRAAQNYAAHYVEQWIAQQAHGQGPFGRPAPAGGPSTPPSWSAASRMGPPPSPPRPGPGAGPGSSPWPQAGP